MARQSVKVQKLKAAGVREVAALANVSLGTVSNVLNSPDRVAPKTRKVVQDAMKKLEFVPSRAAGQLRSKRSSMIGVVVPDVGNPYWASVLRGIEHGLENTDLTIVVASTRQQPERQQSIVSALMSQGVDGLIIAPITNETTAWKGLGEGHFGVVTLEQGIEDSTIPWVSLDNVKGGRLAIEHLLDQGHRRIVFVNGPETVSWCVARRDGAIAGVQARGLDPDVVLMELVVPDLTVEDGESAIDQILASGVDFTGVICANDMLALGALLALRKHGKSVPSDVALVGYDDVDFAQALEPALTSVNQPSFKIGTSAAELLLKAQERTVGEHVQFEPRLIVRESSKLDRR